MPCIPLLPCLRGCHPGTCLSIVLHQADSTGAFRQPCEARPPVSTAYPVMAPHLFALQGVLESFLGTAFAGSIFCLFSGQPLTILSSTGPVLVFERLLFSFSE